MSYKETPETVFKWINETFPGTDPESPRKSLRALEECVELCLASGASYQDIQDAVRKEVDEHIAKTIGGLGDRSNWFARRELQSDKIPVEVADVIIVLYGVAGMRGFDPLAEVDKKMEINRARTWKAMGDGTGYHIK